MRQPRSQCTPLRRYRYVHNFDILMHQPIIAFLLQENVYDIRYVSHYLYSLFHELIFHYYTRVCLFLHLLCGFPLFRLTSILPSEIALKRFTISHQVSKPLSLSLRTSAINGVSAVISIWRVDLYLFIYSVISNPPHYIILASIRLLLEFFYVMVSVECLYI